MPWKGGDMDWTWFTIKPSAYISGLCYSIFRLEPYGFCEHGCVYCYARWYRRGVKPQPWLVRAWRKLAKQLENTWPKPFFRLATLSDPLQPAEKDYMLSLEMLRIALRSEIPVILNTKSDLVAKPPWLDVVLSMADKGLILVQLTIGFNDHTAAMLEPRAPPPTRRLNALEYLVEHSVPVVVRVQPLIPGLEDEQLGVAREVLERGAWGIIAESVRETRQGFQLLSRLLGYDVASAAGGLEPYQLSEVEGKEPLLHPQRGWREAIHTRLALLAKAFGKPYARCKDGLQPEYRLGRDCCLTWLAFRPALRPTLHEYIYAKQQGKTLEELCEKELARLGYVCGNTVNRYPSVVAKGFRLHERRLERLIKSEKHVAKLLSI